MIKRIVELVYQPLKHVLKEVVIKAGLIIVRLGHCWVCPSGVDPSVDHAADIVYLFAWNPGLERTKIRFEMMKYVISWINYQVIEVSYIALTLCSTSRAKLAGDPELACILGRQTMVDGLCTECIECRGHYMNP
jgi:hypothetical protein